MHSLVRAALARALQRKMKVGFPQFADPKQTVANVEGFRAPSGVRKPGHVRPAVPQAMSYGDFGFRCSPDAAEAMTGHRDLPIVRSDR